MNYRLKTQDIVQRCVQAIMNLTGDWEVIIRPYNKKRSNPQNDCFHGWCHIIGQNIGMDAKDVKNALKVKAGMMEVHFVGDEKIYVLRSSADLNTQEFNKLLDHTIALADFHSITLPQGGYDVSNTQ